MRDVELSPDPNLMESLRAVGYSTSTAIADIVDNSVSARAGRVDVFFSAAPEPYVAILDDGEGMDSVELVKAMRLAGRSPGTEREEHDLGRFGLGLKTASLSQCRCLTVISTRDGETNGVRWDLNHLIATETWALQVLEASDIAAVPSHSRLADQTRGTLVVWTDLDRIAERADDIEMHLDERLASAREHLSLVFHRFVAEATPPLDCPLTITFNGAPIPRVDPFLTRHRGTQEGPREIFRVRGAEISVKPYTLPYLKKLTVKDRATALISGTLRDTQGFYIYRAHRLVQWGTWFRLMPKGDMSKLARVQVDIPNSLDDLWSLDIKKSAAIPPGEVRQLLRRLAGQIVRPSRRVQRFRGRQAGREDQIQRLWLLIEERGSFRYEINTRHPLVATLADQLPRQAQQELRELIGALQSTFPVEDAYNRLSEDIPHDAPAVEQAQLAELVRALHASMKCDIETLARRLAVIEPFTEISQLEPFLRGVLLDESS
jgi:hypothetical protein